jgi:hypothetical protein
MTTNMANYRPKACKKGEGTKISFFIPPVVYSDVRGIWREEVLKCECGHSESRRFPAEFHTQRQAQGT